MIAVCAVLGVQQVALKSVAADMSPVLQLALRSGIAACLVTTLMLVRRDRIILRDGTLAPGLLLGGLFTLEYLCLGEGLRYTSASRIVIFLYSAPIFAAVSLHLLTPAERLNKVQWLGILIAFAGISLAFGIREGVEQTDITGSLWGDFLGLLAGFAWGMSTVVVRSTRLADIAAPRTLLYQLATAFVVLSAAAVLLGQTQYTLTSAVIANLLFQGVVVSFACFLAWFALMRRYVASQLGVLAFMTPIFGVTFGIVLLDEPMQLSFFMGAILVVVGILLVSSEQLMRKSMQQEKIQ